MQNSQNSPAVSVDYFLPMKIGTVVWLLNHISSILYPIKFLHRENAPLFNNAPIIKQLRVQANLLPNEGEL